MIARITFLALGALLIGIAATMAASAELPGRKYAVVVGINKYENDNVNPLHYAVNDAQSLAATLRAAGYKVFELTTDRRDSEDYPTRTNLVFRLGWMRDHLRPQDSLVFYFSGHGMEVHDKTFLLTKESDPRTIDTLKESACAADDVNEILGKVKARHILAIYDSCRSNPRADKGGGDNLLNKGSARDLELVKSHGPAAKYADRIDATLFACSPGQRSYEWNDKHHGFFTYYLIQGLKGAAGNHGVTLDELVKYVNKEVREATNDEGDHQSPYLTFSGTGLDGWVVSPGHLKVSVNVNVTVETDDNAPARPEPQAQPQEEQPTEEPAPTQPTYPTHPTKTYRPPHPTYRPPHSAGRVDPSIVGHWETNLGSISADLEMYANGTFVERATPAAATAMTYKGTFTASGGRYTFHYTYAAMSFGPQTPGEVPPTEFGQYVVRSDGLYNRPANGSLAGYTLHWTRVPYP